MASRPSSRSPKLAGEEDASLGTYGKVGKEGAVKSPRGTALSAEPVGVDSVAVVGGTKVLCPLFGPRANGVGDPAVEGAPGYCCFKEASGLSPCLECADEYLPLAEEASVLGVAQRGGMYCVQYVHEVLEAICQLMGSDVGHDPLVYRVRARMRQRAEAEAERAEGQRRVRALHEGLQVLNREAGARALALEQEAERRRAERGVMWRACAEEFFRNLQPYPEPEKTRFWRRLRRLARLRKKTAA